MKYHLNIHLRNGEQREVDCIRFFVVNGLLTCVLAERGIRYGEDKKDREVQLLASRSTRVVVYLLDTIAAYEASALDEITPLPAFIHNVSAKGESA